jgi:hypothetical protein
MKDFIVLAGILALMSGAALNAQVTIGYDKSPESFSVLELISNDTRGLRLPQLTTVQRNAINLNALAEPQKTMAMGLTIFNTTTGCVETWNSTAWIAACAPCNTPLSAPSLTSMEVPKPYLGYITVGDYPQFKFYLNASDGEPLDTTVLLVDGNYYISVVADLYCESSRTLLSVTFVDPTVDIPPEQAAPTGLIPNGLVLFGRTARQESVLSLPKTPQVLGLLL